MMTFAPDIIDGCSVAYFDAALGKITRLPWDADPVARAEAVRWAFGLWKGNRYDAYGQCAGEFDFSSGFLAYPGCTCAGMGREATINKSSWFDWDGQKRVAFEFGNGTVLEEMAFRQSSLDNTVDGICIGFAAPNRTATMRGVSIFGREWGLYGWQPDCNLTIDDFDITAGRVCVGSEDSGDGQHFALRHGTIVGDASLSQCAASYDVSNADNGGIFGVVHRGGLMSMDDVRIQITGQAAPPRAVAITDRGGHNGGSAGNTRLDLWNVRANVTANGADPKRCGGLDLSDLWIIQHLKARYCSGLEFISA